MNEHRRLIVEFAVALASRTAWAPDKLWIAAVTYAQASPFGLEGDDEFGPQEPGWMLRSPEEEEDGEHHGE